MSSPDHARMVAQHTADALRTMRREQSAANLTTQFNAWMNWAKAERVAIQIRSHVIGAYAECKREIAEAKP